jgi:hypothetical protein
MLTTTITKHSGLCNRIKNIWVALLKYENIKTTVDTDAYIFPSLEKVINPINPYPPNWRLEVLEEEQKYLTDYKTIDFLYEKTPQYFIDKYLKSVEKLKINPDIEEYVNDFTLGWDDVIGVQIRTWFNERSVLHDNIIFEKEIEKLSKDKRIFLCSDNSDVIKYFKQKYSNRIITHPQALHSQSPQSWNDQRIFDDLQLVVDGFIDCFILSKCDIIIGTWISTFSEVAWWLGGCKSKVIIPKPLNGYQKFIDDVFIKE